MFRTAYPTYVLILLCALPASALAQEIIDPAEAVSDPDFAVQGEYLGNGVLPDGGKGPIGAQVIALGDAQFDVVLYKGGLPGDGWQRGDERFFLKGKREDKIAQLTGENLSGEIADGKMTLAVVDAEEKVQLKRTERKSPTLGAEPPEGALVLFDGSHVDHFPGATLTDMKTLQAGTSSKSSYKMASLHLEFRLSYKPTARGQGRSNSGVYLGGCPEIQVLDSFGLEGKQNECGALYGRKEPDVNMCLPPLLWQTYDVEFTPAKYDGQTMIAKPQMTVRHNGVVIHREYEVSQRSAEGRNIHLQSHGNRVQYGNIWLVEQK